MAASEFRQHTHWSAVGTPYRFEIIGIYGRGVGADYVTTRVELKWMHLPQTQFKTTAEMQELLTDEKIKRIA